MGEGEQELLIAHTFLVINFLDCRSSPGSATVNILRQVLCTPSCPETVASQSKISFLLHLLQLKAGYHA